MPRPLNLISDSPLVQETFDLLSECGGRATFTQIADSIFHLTNATEELTVALIADLIQNDPRFSIEGNYLAIKPDEIEIRPLNEIDFVVVDVEAVSGRSIPTRVIEIGACRVRGGEISDEFEVLLNPDLPVPRFISALTGINDEMLSTAPRFADIAERWLEFVGDSIIVAHNSSFDLTLLNQEVARVFPGCRMRNADVCTVKLARRVAPYLDNHHLDALAEHFGFEITQRHRAAGDARATAHVLLRLLDELEIHGVRTLAGARKFQLRKHGHAAMQLALDA
jgi:DNA polymerase III epsilon subunit family exonuclease